MTFKKTIFLIFASIFFISKLSSQVSKSVSELIITSSEIRVGAEQFENYLPLLRNKRVALMTNQTSVVGQTHLLDTLISLGVNVVKVFGPEHGFRGKAGAGEAVDSHKDSKTGVEIVSLYGSKKKPSNQDLSNVDIVLFDIQDVGVRFYTYISSLHLLMEACAENSKVLIILDRPNPNGYYVDGPILKDGFQSFVGMSKIPVVHGLTVGEYALMVDGEKWLSSDSLKCEFYVIPVQGYSHENLYQLPVAPSPNLPNMSSVYLYPSLCFFEGTPVSVGRGTDKPFQSFGHPKLGFHNYQFTPKSIESATNPPFKDVLCNGFDLSDFGSKIMIGQRNINLFWLMSTYEGLGCDSSFFTSFFDKLAGNSDLKRQIMEFYTEEQIRKTWQPELDEYLKMRSKYLIYSDFIK